MTVSRRDFLKQTALVTGGGMAAASISTAEAVTPVVSAASEPGLRITGVEIFPVRVQPNGDRVWTFLRLDTNAGIHGWGEMYWVPFSSPVVIEMVRDIVNRLVVNRNPYHIEAMWQRLYTDAYTHFPDYTRMSIISGIEMACWDIIGKDLGKTIYDVLGGPVRDRIRTYCYHEMGLPEPERAVFQRRYERARNTAAREKVFKEWMRATVDAGYTGLKIDPLGAGPEEDEWGQVEPLQLSLKTLDEAERTISLMREAFGSDADIMIGTHGQMTPDAAIRLAKRLEPYDPLWFEEPIPPDNIPAMAQVAKETSIPVCTGERLSTKYDFAEVLKFEAASILNLDLGRVGGILEAKKVAAIAEASYAQITPHTWAGPIQGAASLHIGYCCTNFLIQECHDQWGGFFAELLQEPIKWEKGFAYLNSKPGLGYELNLDVANQYSAVK